MSLAEELLACDVDPTGTTAAIVGDPPLSFQPVHRLAPVVITLTARPSKSMAAIVNGSLSIDQPGRFIVSASCAGFAKTYELVAFPTALSKVRPQLRALCNDHRIPAATLAEMLAAPSAVAALVNVLNWIRELDSKPLPGRQVDGMGKLAETQSTHVCVRCHLANTPGRTECERCGSRQFHADGHDDRRWDFYVCGPCGAILPIPIAVGEEARDYDPSIHESEDMRRSLVPAGRSPNKPHKHQVFWSAKWIQPTVDAVLGPVSAACSGRCHEATIAALESALAPPPPPAPVPVEPAPQPPRPVVPIVESAWVPR